MGIMAWSPLAGGLLTGKYRQETSGTGHRGEGRLETMKESGNPSVAKFTNRNWAIVSELERVAKELDRSMAQVALNWVVGRPALGAAIIGATKLSQLEDNLKALDFSIPDPLLKRLDAVSAIDPGFPYVFYEPYLQGMIHGGVSVSTTHRKTS